MSEPIGLTPTFLVIDVPAVKHAEVVTFWSAVLGATPRWPDDDRDPYVPLDGARSALQVMVQRADGVPRFHVDLPADDRHATADRLLTLGATKAQRHDDHWVMRDPAGLLFCLTPHEAPQAAPLAPREPARAYLDGLFIDVPGPQVDAELAFWSAALDAEVVPTSRPETYTALTGVRAPGGDLLVEVQRIRDGAPRFHVDVSTDDVEAEAERVEALGAMRVGEIESWTTFADPAGNLFCVVPR